MRVKARLSAFKKRFFVIRNTAIRRAAPHIRCIRRHTALCTVPPARRRRPTRADRALFTYGKRGGRPPKPSRQQRAGRCGGAQHRHIRRYGEASGRSTSIARRAFAFVNALPTRAEAAPSLSRGIRTAVCRICIPSGSSKKSAGCLANSPFYRLKNRLPARIITVTV